MTGIRKGNQMTINENVFVFMDIDGCIANAEKRFLRAGPEPKRAHPEAHKEWLKTVQTLEELATDQPVAGMAELCTSLASRTKFYYLTSRGSSLLSVTWQWLVRNSFPTAELLMRSDLDKRDLGEYKEAYIDTITKKCNNPIIIVFDDDEHGELEEVCKRRGWTFLKARSGGQI